MGRNLKYYQDNPERFLDDLLSIIGEESALPTIALRGIYAGDVYKKELERSSVWIDGVPTNKKLAGTSGLLVAGDWDYDSRKTILTNLTYSLPNVGKYGDTDYVAVMRGNAKRDEPTEDAHEIILGNAEVICYIERGE